MTIKNYGCWKATPVSFTSQTLQQDKSPHITLKFTDDDGSTEHEADINVASTDSDHDLVYWLHRTWHHPITMNLTPLEQGFHEATSSNKIALDYVRADPKLLDFSAGRVLPNNEPGKNNDILDQLKPILNDAIEAKAQIYLFGSEYTDGGAGIHDIHMNQGDSRQYDNAVSKDGAILFHYSGGDQHWEAVFLAFATQKVPTDPKTGDPTSDAKALSELAHQG